MKSVQLKVEHRHQNKFLKQRHLRPGNRYFTVGSSRDADFRLLGDNVMGIHAIIDFREDAWYVSDVGSIKGSMDSEQKKTDIVEHKITGPMKFEICGHTIDVRPHEVRRVLFQKEERDINSSRSDELAHQVVVRQKGHVVETIFLPANANYDFGYGIKRESLPAPKTKQWVWHEFGNLTIQQRLVGLARRNNYKPDTWKEFFPEDIRRSLIGAMVTMAVLIGALSIPYGSTDKKEEVVVEIPKELNPYTQMIYDAKVVKKKIAKAEKLGASIINRGKPMGPNPNPNSPVDILSPTKNPSGKNLSYDLAPGLGPAGGNGKAAGGGQAAIRSIKAANLGGLIGRLSKRTTSGTLVRVNNTDNNNVTGGIPAGAVAVAGLANVGKGTGLGAVGVGTGTGTGGGGTHKIGGVGTVGAGGASSYRTYGALTPGSVGTGNVATIDEETDVEGGLDREVISQFISTQIGHIRYCYERQLSAKPDLYGKIKVQFTIGATGSVVQSKIGSSTLQDAVVEGCILKRVASWVFPTPKGGTTVLVSYPFLFKSTN
ncbi:MAG: hypothetical protein A4S09_04425 [Proteobacteria bacterium SG_bin7]|nr:MAG: hypothetical protein A4S09_04425 [Proteobacteria bacterium SG_bin7]